VNSVAGANQQFSTRHEKGRIGLRRLTGFAVVLLVLAVGLVAWRFGISDYPLELGRPLDPSSAVGLAEVLSSPESFTETRTVLRGRVGQVCRSVGCWFVLQEVRNGRLHEVLVDLKKSGTFTVPKDATGRTAFVSGKLVGVDSDTRFEADGVKLE